MTIVVVMLLGVAVVISGGCTEGQNASLIGSLAGAGIGQLAGGDTEATLIGAAVGAGAGYIFGNESDKNNAAAERRAIRTEQNMITVWMTNSNGSKVPVKLARNGPNFIGPRGEVYTSLPTSQQLRPIYGF